MNIAFVDAASLKADELHSKINAVDDSQTAIVIKSLNAEQLINVINFIDSKTKLKAVIVTQNITLKYKEAYIIPLGREFLFDGKKLVESSSGTPHAAYNFEAITEHSLNEIYIFNTTDLKFEFVNKGALDNLGYSLKKMKTMTATEIKPDFTLKAFKAVIKPLIEGKKEKIIYETRHQRADGSTYPVEVHLQIMQQNGKPFFVAIILDITVWKVAREEILDTTNKLLTMANNYPSGSISLLDKNLNIIFTEGEGYKTHNIDPAGLIGLNAKDALPPPIYSELKNALPTLKNKEFTTYEVFFNELYYQGMTKPIFDDKGQFQYYILRVTDITHIHNNQQSLLLEKNKLAAITKALDNSALVSITDKKGIILHANEDFCRVSKYTEKQLIGKSHNIINSGYHPKAFWLNMWRTIAAGKTWRADVKNKAKDGTYYWVDTVINPTFDIDGKIEGFLSIRNLITDKKLLELEQAELTKKLSLAISSADLGGFVWHLDTDRVEWNYRMKEIYQFPEFDGKMSSWLPFIHPDDVEQRGKHIENLIKNDKKIDFELRIIRRDGSIAHIHGYAITEKENGKVVRIHGVNRDITKEKTAKEELLKITNKLNLATKAAKIGMFTWNSQTLEINWDKQENKIFGLKDYDGSLEVWKKLIHPDDLDLVMATTDKLYTGELKYNDYSFRIIKPNGKIAHIKSIASRQKIDGVDHVIGLNWDITAEQEKNQEILDLKLKYELALKASDDGFFDVDLVTNVAEYSDTYCKMLGIKINSLNYDRSLWVRLLHPEDKERVLTEIDIALQSNIKYYNVECRMRHKKGHYFYTIARCFINRDPKGMPVRITGTLMDLTKIKAAEIALKESEAKFRFITENTSDGIAVFENDEITYSSEAYDRILGYDKKENIKRDKANIFNTVHPEDRERVFKMLDDGINNKVTSLTYQFRAKHKEGHYIWREDTANYFYNEEGKMEKAVLIARDITDRKNNELALQESEAKHKFIVDTSQELICLHDLDGFYKFLSPSVEAITGYKAEELLGKDPYGLFHPDDVVRILNESHLPVVNGQNIDNIQYRFKRKDGEYIWLDTYTQTIKDEDGNIISLLTGSRDITSLKTTQIELADKEEMLQNIADSIPGLMMQYKINPDGTDQILFVSKGAESLWEMPQEVILKDVDKLWAQIHPDDLAEFAKTVAASAEKLETWSYEYRIIMDDGRIKWLSAIGQPKALPDGGILWHSLALDITDKKNVELQLQESTELLNSVADNIPGAIMRNISYDDGTRQILYVSKGSQDLFEIDNNDYPAFQKTLINKIHPDDLSHYEKSVIESITNNKSWVLEFRMVMDDGRIKWLSGKSVPKKEKDGSVIWNGLYLDITNRKTAELALEKTLDQLNLGMEAGKFGIWERELSTGISECNDQMHEILEIPKEEFTLNTRLHDLIVPEDLDYLNSIRSRVINGENVRDAQLKIKCKSGRIKSLYSSSMPVKNEKGEVIKTLGIFMDVTHIAEYQEQLKAALQDKENLFKELHHRIKNNLQMVSSLLFLKASNEDDDKFKSFINETSVKIHSISAIHEQLLQLEGINTLDIKDYLERLCGHLMKTYLGIYHHYDLHIDIDSATMPLDTVLNIGFITNEIISNSIKYAYPNTEGGALYVSLKKQKNTFTLKVADDGVGISDEQIEKLGASYGMQLIDVFAKQIKGDLDINNKKGTAYTIKFPAHV